MRPPQSSANGRHDSLHYRELQDAKSYLLSGFNVDVVGRFGSGRTAFLHALHSSLRADAHRVYFVTGIPDSGETPLLPLQLAGVLQSGITGTDDLVTGVSALAPASPRERVIVIIDDAASLSDLSWGVLASAHALAEFAIVTSRHASENLTEASRARLTLMGSSLTITVPPLSVSNLTPLLEQELGGHLDAQTASRIHSKSAGNPGLALAMVASARAARSLFLRDGSWHGGPDLWSPALSGIVAGILNRLPEHEREGLRQLSEAGLVDRAAGAAMLGAHEIDSLAAKGYLRLFHSRGHEWITIEPPLIAEYFRHALHSPRLLETDEAVGIHAWGTTDVAPAKPSLPPADSSLFLLARESRRSALIDADRAWASDPTPPNGLALLDALTTAAAPEAEISELYRRLSALPLAPQDQARLLVWEARWKAHARDDLAAATDALVSAIDCTTPTAPLLVTALFDLCATHGRVLFDPCDPRLIDLAGTPAELSALQQSQAHVLFLQGRISESQQILELHGDHWSSTSRGLANAEVLLGSGKLFEAISAALPVLETGLDELDAAVALRAGYIIAVAFALQGRYREVLQLFDVVSPLDSPTWFPCAAAQDLRAVAAFSAMRAHDERRIADFSDELRAAKQSDQPQRESLAIATAYQRYAEKSPDAAQSELAESGWEHVSRGMKFYGALELLVALNFEPNPALTVSVDELVGQLSSELLRVYSSFFVARDSGSPEALLTVAEAMQPMMLAPQAIAAFRTAKEFATNSDRSDSSDGAIGTETGRPLSDEIDERFERFLELATAADININLVDIPSTRLSPREAEIAGLLVAGLSNQEIASELVISTRTVANHVHRITQKVHAKSRTHLLKYLAALLQDR